MLCRAIAKHLPPRNVLQLKNLNLSSSNMRFLAFARNDITVILKGNTLKNLPPSQPIVRSLTYVRDDKRCYSDDRKGGRISFQRTSASGFLSLDHRSRFGTKNETELSYSCYRNVNALHLSCNEKERLLLSKNYGNQMKRFTKIITVICLLLTMPTAARCAVIKGSVKDNSTGEPLAGATVSVVGTTTAAFTDETGSFELKNLKIGSYTLIINYISYQSETLSDLKVLESTPLVLDIRLKPDDQTLDEVVVVGQMRRNTELGMIAATKTSLVIQNGVSSQQIKIAQDKDASEAIRRVPGISIIDNKFVMVRGLSQRYNNVWINGSAVPSTEADSRAFSFDIIPSSQLENIAIVKSPAPEYQPISAADSFCSQPKICLPKTALRYRWGETSTMRPTSMTSSIIKVVKPTFWDSTTVCAISTVVWTPHSNP